MFLRYFVTFNRKLCGLLQQRFPKIFIDYRNYDEDLLHLVNQAIAQISRARILEVGGVDRPMLTKSKNFKYSGMDIEDKPSCYDCYDEFIVSSIENRINDSFDIIFSKTLLEHVPNNRKSIKAMYDGLNSNGVMLHYIPSKNHFYSVCLRLVGARLQKILIKYLRPAAVSVSGYPAFFDACTPGQMEKLCKTIGFKEIEIIPYYKATDYFAFFVPAYLFVALFENIFEYLKLSQFSSGFILVAKK